tara:strand:+ start:794 stop:1804 length:1011 start_codon:yes stop_codon:yes gene_type:complete
MQTAGYIKLHRKIMESEVFEDASLFRTWCWCLIEANWDKRTTRRNETIERGEFITGYRKAASVLGISKNTVARQFRKLERLKMIVTRSGTLGTHVLVYKYREYQASDDELRDTLWDDGNRCQNIGTLKTKKSDAFIEKRGTLENDTSADEIGHLENTSIKRRDADGDADGDTMRDADGDENKNRRITKNKRKSFARDFGLFWDVYPRRVAKQNAFSAFKKAARSTDAEIIIAAAEAFGKSPKAKGDFCPYPATWLRGERWLDDPKEWNEGGGNNVPFKVKTKTQDQLRFDAAETRLVAMRTAFLNMPEGAEREIAVKEWLRCKEILANMERVADAK